MPFKPVSERNAIDAMAFKLIFSQPVGEAVFKAIEENSSILMDELPSMEVKRDITFRMEAKNTVTENVSGFVFYQPLEDGSHEKSLEIAAEHIVFRCRKYDSWTSQWAFAKKKISLLAPLIPDFNLISSVGLEYTDVFTSHVDPSLDDINSLLKRDSRYLPLNCIQKGFWHVNQGFYEEGSLVNINVRHQRERSKDWTRWAVVINIIHRMNQSPTKLSDMLESCDIDKKMRQMHSFDKVVLSEIITVESAKSIGLI